MAGMNFEEILAEAYKSIELSLWHLSRAKVVVRKGYQCAENEAHRKSLKRILAKLKEF